MGDGETSTLTINSNDFTGLDARYPRMYYVSGTPNVYGYRIPGNISGGFSVPQNTNEGVLYDVDGKLHYSFNYGGTQYDYDLTAAATPATGLWETSGGSAQLIAADDINMQGYQLTNVDYFGILERTSHLTASSTEGQLWVSEGTAGTDGRLYYNHGAYDFGNAKTIAFVEDTVDHGALSGLGDDDHTQYLLVDGSRVMSGGLDMDDNSIDGVQWLRTENRTTDLAASASGGALWTIDTNGRLRYRHTTYDTGNVKNVAFTDEILSDHGALSGLGDDDHTQYILQDGGRAMSGNLSLGTNNLINVAAISDGTAFVLADDNFIDLGDSGSDFVVSAGDATALKLYYNGITQWNSTGTSIVIRPTLDVADATLTLTDTLGTLAVGDTQVQFNGLTVDFESGTGGTGGYRYKFGATDALRFDQSTTITTISTDSDKIKYEDAQHVNFLEQAGDPTPVANEGFLYTKEADTITELFYQPDSGSAIQITPLAITVKEADGAPSVTRAQTVSFDQADGFTVTDSGGGVATIGFVAGPDDNLGDHTADQDLDMAGFDIFNANYISNKVTDATPGVGDEYLRFTSTVATLNGSNSAILSCNGTSKVTAHSSGITLNDTVGVEEYIMRNTGSWSPGGSDEYLRLTSTAAYLNASSTVYLMINGTTELEIDSTDIDVKTNNITGVAAVVGNAIKESPGSTWEVEIKAQNAIKVAATGTAPEVGFFGATPVVQESTVSDPSGGAVIDSEARTAINAVIDLLQAYGLMA